jgi:hypothetical protein
LGWDLLSYSWEELKANKRLLIFPVLGTLSALALFIAMFYRPGAPHHWLMEPFQPARWFLFYCSCTFVMNFFDCALAACAQIRYSGGQPTAADGLRRAIERIDAILFWSLIAATVGMMLNKIEQHLSVVGKLLVRVFGYAWVVATFLVVPVLVIERAGALRAVRRSTRLLRETWGEQLSVDIGLGLWLLALFLPGIALAIAGYYSYPVVMALGVAWIAAVFVGMEALTVMFQVALYRYAIGDAPAAYPADILRNALRGGARA